MRRFVYAVALTAAWAGVMFGLAAISPSHAQISHAIPALLR